jgi:hypothetical protein
MADPRLLSAEDLMRIVGNLKSVVFMAAAIPLAGHIDAQAEQIAELKDQVIALEREAYTQRKKTTALLYTMGKVEAERDEARAELLAEQQRVLDEENPHTERSV